MKRMLIHKNAINPGFISSCSGLLKYIARVSLSALTGLYLFACQDKVIERYRVSAAVYMSYTELRSSIKSKPATETKIAKPGKIYFWNNYLFVNEYNKGIHVIGNSDPANPVFKTFINIPGNVDMSIKGGILYADSYIDLVALDISDIQNVKEVKRIDSIFPYTIPESFSQLLMEQIEPQKGVVVGYEEKYVEKDAVQYENRYYPIYAYDKIALGNNGGVIPRGNGAGVGIGGSMARFTINKDVLYAINNSIEILIFDITDVRNPIKMGGVTTMWGIETLFPYKNRLFVGSQTGMLIYDLANPFQPQYITTYSHVRSCDPVVVEGNYAYVTLRTGTRCYGNVNRLDIVNISDIANPVLVKEYDMTNPHGLGIDNNLLFAMGRRD
ncbi:MAG: LVIVD repeat-containing protein [Bacteroidales bacterium]